MTTKIAKNEEDFLRQIGHECEIVWATEAERITAMENALTTIREAILDRMADLIADGEAELASFAPKV